MESRPVEGQLAPIGPPKMGAMTDSPHWQTALLTLDWGDNLSRLETWIRGRTITPHWTEFEKNWLIRSEGSKIPSLSHIISGCMQAWKDGTNEYYIKHPNISHWHEKEGLGHYIRLLTMIVRENMATNAVWPIVNAKDVQQYFQKALVIVNCMREEWSQKGPLYLHYQSILNHRKGTIEHCIPIFQPY